MKHGASAPALHLSAASKRALLAVDLAASDPALASGGGGKRLRVSTATAGGDDDDEEEEEGADDGHAGGRGESMLRRRFEMQETGSHAYLKSNIPGLFFSVGSLCYYLGTKSWTILSRGFVVLLFKNEILDYSSKRVRCVIVQEKQSKR